MSKEHFNLLSQFLDVLVWLLKLGFEDPIELKQVTNTAINQTSEKFNKSYDEVKNLVLKEDLTPQTKEEAEVITFYFVFLRRIRDSRQ